MKIHKAAELFATSTELDDSVARYWFWLGRARQLLNNTAAAVSAFDECLRRNPYHQSARNTRDFLNRYAEDGSTMYHFSSE